jgi:predicted RNA-binding protein associated with RNAse of E/G family
LAPTTVESEDLELDLLVAADRRTIRLDDEAEFAARDLLNSDPQAHAAALAAVEELRDAEP